MIFHKTIEKAYKSRMYVRCDGTGLASYFGPQDFDGLHCEGYKFRSSHGHDLQGYFYCYGGYDTERLIIFEHGFGGGHRSYMKEIEKLCQGGYRVFAYDHTGCMESGGENANGFAQSLCDLNDCINALKADEGVNTSDISVMGHSWGGFSTLNIAALHPDVKRIVVLSGFISVEKIVEQNFSGILKGYKKHIMELERSSNPDFIKYNAVDTLRNASTRALLIYSDNDIFVNKSLHYDELYNNLKDRDNIELILTTGKGHNPNYTHDAVVCLAELAEKNKSAKNIKTEDEKKKFRDQFDWDKMTAQDDTVWNKIFDFLK